MVSGEGPVRDLDAIRLPEWGRVMAAEGVVPWRVEDGAGDAVGPVQRYLLDLVAQGKSLGTVRSYAFVLLRWWRFLRAAGVQWDRATSAETRDFVLWFQRASKPGAGRRRVSAPTAGTGNPV